MKELGQARKKARPTEGENKTASSDEKSLCQDQFWSHTGAFECLAQAAGCLWSQDAWQIIECRDFC